MPLCLLSEEESTNQPAEVSAEKSGKEMGEGGAMLDTEKRKLPSAQRKQRHWNVNANGAKEAGPVMTRRGHGSDEKAGRIGPEANDLSLSFNQ